MMPLLFPKFPPQERETHAQREIRRFQQKARDSARMQRRAMIWKALLWPGNIAASLVRTSAQLTPRRSESSKNTL